MDWTHKMTSAFVQSSKSIHIELGDTLDGILLPEEFLATAAYLELIFKEEWQ